MDLGPISLGPPWDLRVERCPETEAMPRSPGRRSAVSMLDECWLPDDGGDEYLWSEGVEKPRKHRRTPAKVALESSEHPEPQPTLSLRERAVERAKRNGIVRTKDLEASIPDSAGRARVSHG